MNTTRHSFVLAALAAMPLCAQGLQHPQGLLDQLRAPIHRDVDPDGLDRGIWTAGRDWSASLHDGASFRAVQPPDVDAQPWRWRTTAVTVGGVALPLDAPRPRVATSFRCEYDLGAVVEAYDVCVEGLEQTFVLRTPTSRDVVIEGAVVSALQAAPRSAMHAPIDFVPAGRGNGVRYGAALAVDANGATLPLATAWTGERLRIDVPGDWLAHAVWPVVVDPLLTTIMLDVASSPITHVRVERDERNPTYEIGYAFERQTGANTRDLFFMLANDNLQGALVVFSRIALPRELRPEIAFLYASNRWVIGWNAFDYTQSRDRSGIYLHTGADVTPGGSTQWGPGVANRRQRNLCIGGSRSSGSTALLVWESDVLGTTGNAAGTQIHTCTFDTTANTYGTPVHLAGNNVMFPGECEAPAVTRDRGAGSWVVAWQHMRVLPFHWDVVAQRVGVSGAAAAGTFLADQLGTMHQFNPVVDGRDGNYMIAFATAPLGPLADTTMGHALRTQRFEWGNTAVGPTDVGPSQQVFGPANYPAYRPDAIAYDKDTRSHWALSTSQLFWNVPITGFAVLGHDAKLRDNFYPGGSDSHATGVAFDDDAHQFVLGYGDQQNGFRRAMGVRFAYPAVAAPVTYALGCGNAANVVDGSGLAGDGTQELRLASAPTGVPAVLALSLAPASAWLPAPFASGCNLFVDIGGNLLGTLAMLTDGIGQARVPLPLPSTLSSFDVHVQWFHLEPAQNAFVASDGVRFQIR